MNAACPTRWSSTTAPPRRALTNFCKALSKEVRSARNPGQHHQPGPVATDLWLGAGGVAETVAGARGQHPRAVAAAAVADTRPAGSPSPARSPISVLFLASPRAGNITGADFAIDGGLKTTL